VLLLGIIFSSSSIGKQSIAATTGYGDDGKNENPLPMVATTLSPTPSPIDTAHDDVGEAAVDHLHAWIFCLLSEDNSEL